MTIDIRRQEPADAAGVRRVLTDAFGDGGRVADLAEALRARSDTQASLVAVERDRVIGHTHLSVSWVDAPTRLVEVLTLSPLGVSPERQSRGVGRQLLLAAIATAEALGVPLVFLEGDPGYYAPRGWRAAVDLGFAPPSTRIPRPAFHVTALASYDPASMSGALVYNDTFWSHDCVGLRR